MLHFQIDPHSGVPIYRQVMDQIRYYLASGVLASGSQLPSIRELAQTLSVNPTTIVKAYTELEHQGIIEMKHGKGAFIAASTARMTDQEREEVLRRLVGQMAVEACQIGGSTELVLRLVKEEMVKITQPSSKSGDSSHE
jgi:GntR family transcriptional regulator